MSGELERITRVAFVGFGEAGGILGAALAAKGVQVSMYDVRIGALREKAALLGRAGGGHARAGHRGGAAHRFRGDGAGRYRSSRSCRVRHRAGAGLYSTSTRSRPGLKRHAQSVIEAARAHYVEAAVMAPVPAERHARADAAGGHAGATHRCRC